MHSIDTWLRLSYKQLVFHKDLYLHRFTILKIVTFDKLVNYLVLCNWSHQMHQFSFFLFETPVEINTWLLSFHQMHYTSLSSPSPKISLLSENNPCNCYVITINRAIGCQCHVAARYRLIWARHIATLCFAVDILSPFHWSPTNVQCSLSSQKECVFTALNINTITILKQTRWSLFTCVRPVIHWPHYPRSDDENMTSEWHFNNAAEGP